MQVKDCHEHASKFEFDFPVRWHANLQYTYGGRVSERQYESNACGSSVVMSTRWKSVCSASLKRATFQFALVLTFLHNNMVETTAGIARPIFCTLWLFYGIGIDIVHFYDVAAA